MTADPAGARPGARRGSTGGPDNDCDLAGAEPLAADLATGEVPGIRNSMSRSDDSPPPAGPAPRNGRRGHERVALTVLPGASFWESDAAVVELARPRRNHPERPRGVLTNRLAAALVSHEPGWRLPRLSVLAKQYDTTSDLLAEAISELIARGLIRRTPEGQLCRASPAHYVLPFGGSLRDLRARAVPAGGDLGIKSRSISVHPVRDDIEWALQIASHEPASIVQVLWTVGGQPAAITATYLAPKQAEALITRIDAAEPDAIRVVLPLTPLAPAHGQDANRQSWLAPTALHAEMQQPPRWAAQALGLTACQRAVMITTRYDDSRDSRPVALTVAVLRPEQFRVTIASGEPILRADAAGFWPGWNHVAGDWDF
jgi:hypothetical protein